ncbi:acetylcholine receptor subunit beta-like isoform X1 [Dreissena polymorpha]|uniref:acetylcholine receptor subunit beta-like isoform X1 n=1 Tax=Dreissena polymorpha TaxID=45954 RepID=UPI0022649519|nr:acetylcholine receptor subunit beta-like isoform X1 [Dreissena polymorpha]
MRLTLLVIFVDFVVPMGTSTVDDVNRLLARAKSSNYNKRIRPLKNQTNAIEVKLGLILHSILDFDIPKEALSTSVQLQVHWQDELLAWEKDDYGGIEEMLFPQDDIWKPDLRLNNSYKSFTGFGSADLSLWVSNDGNVSWFPIQVLDSQCSVETSRFPHDTQTCSLFFESACYPESQLKLLRSEGGKEVTYYQQNSAWYLKSNYTVEHEPGAVEFKLELERRPSYYMIHIFGPIIVVSILGPFTFLLPADSGSRISFASTLFLTFGVCLTRVASEIPKNCEDTPRASHCILALSICHALIILISLVQRFVMMLKKKNKSGIENESTDSMLEKGKERNKSKNKKKEKKERNLRTKRGCYFMRGLMCDASLFILSVIWVAVCNILAFV